MSKSYCIYSNRQLFPFELCEFYHGMSKHVTYAYTMNGKSALIFAYNRLCGCLTYAQNYTRTYVHMREHNALAFAGIMDTNDCMTTTWNFPQSQLIQKVHPGCLDAIFNDALLICEISELDKN